MKTEYNVMIGDFCLGVSSSYGEALEWVKNHDAHRVSGPYARIVKCQYREPDIDFDPCEGDGRNFGDMIRHNYGQLKAMRDLMCSCNNEDYYTDWWLYHYPDGASDEELMEIAADEDDFKDIACAFLRIMADIYEKNNLYNLIYLKGKIDEERTMEEIE